MAHKRTNSSQAKDTKSQPQLIVSGGDGWTDRKKEVVISNPSSIILSSANLVYGAGKKISGKLNAKRLNSDDILRPGDGNYPKYENCLSTPNIHEIPLLQTSSLSTASPTKLEFGPEDGFFEVINSLAQRKEDLKELIKKVQINPNYLEETNTKLNEIQINLENLKKKLINLKKFEKKLKKNLVNLQTQKVSRRVQQDTRFYGETTHTYAYNHIKDLVDGLPNADSFFIEGFSRMILFGVADGIGWGEGSRKAAQAALLAFFIKFKNSIENKKNRNKVWDTLSICDIFGRAIHFISDMVDSLTEGKTTLCGGVLIELIHQSHHSQSLPHSPGPIPHSPSHGREHSQSVTQLNAPSPLNPHHPTLEDFYHSQLNLQQIQNQQIISQYHQNSYLNVDNDDSTDSFDKIIKPLPKRWTFVGISVGDSLIYRFSVAHFFVSELTSSDRTGGVRDAGGALGGFEPDLRNFSYHSSLLDEGDLIIAVSDGVHDNLDPEVLHISPQQAFMDLLSHPFYASCFSLSSAPTASSWSNISDDAFKNLIKRKFKEKKLLDVILSNQNDFSTTRICKSIISFVEDSTKDHRKAIEDGTKLQKYWDTMLPDERERLNEQVQNGLRDAKGKFDHVTCVCIRVGQYSLYSTS